LALLTIVNALGHGNTNTEVIGFMKAINSWTLWKI